jgi:hypothetical protein
MFVARSILLALLISKYAVLAFSPGAPFSLSSSKIHMDKRALSLRRHSCGNVSFLSMTSKQSADAKDILASRRQLLASIGALTASSAFASNAYGIVSPLQVHLWNRCAQALEFCDCRAFLDSATLVCISIERIHACVHTFWGRFLKYVIS